MTGGENVAGNPEKVEPKPALLYQASRRSVQAYESYESMKLMNQKYICNAVQRTLSRSLAWLIVATCQMHPRHHRKRLSGGSDSLQRLAPDSARLCLKLHSSFLLSNIINRPSLATSFKESWS